MNAAKWIALAALAALAAPRAVSAQQRGDWVLARWQGGTYWFPGVIETRDGTMLSIAYDDGTKESLTLDKVRLYDWALGTRIQCRWKGGAEWYAGEITAISRDGITMDVAYDDGDKEQTRTGACRAP